MLELMETKPYKTVTVREIIESADICRTTFYAHYRDVYDLVESIGNEIIAELVSECRKLIGRPYIEGQHPIVTSMISLLMKYKSTVNVLLGQNGDISFITKLKTTLIENSLLIYAKKYPHSDKNKALLCSSFLISGTLSMYTSQLENNIEYSAEELGYIVGELLVAVEPYFFQ